METKRRLGIVAMHDDQGIADDYLLYLLDDLKNHLEYLVVVSNGALKEETVKRLMQYADDVFIRPDQGYDAAAFKEIQIKQIGWNKVQEYDELVLVNDSWYGPFCSFKSMFERMEKKDSDFWALSCQPETDTPECKVPYHVQPYFLVVRKRLLCSNVYCEFWETLGDTNDFSNAVKNYELRLTEYFTSAGYKASTFMDSEGLMSDYNLVYIMEQPFLCMSKYQLPSVKRKCFSMGIESGLKWSLCQDISRIMDYINKQTPYDVNLIWKNLIRHIDPGIMKRNLKMDYTLPTGSAANKKDLRTYKAAIAVGIFQIESINTCIAYLSEIWEKIDIYVYTISEDMKSKIESACINNNISNVDIQTTEQSLLIFEIEKIFYRYDYICVLHDGMGDSLEYSSMDQSSRYSIWENMLKNENYVSQVLSFMEEHVYIGLLLPPEPYHQRYFSDYGDKWGGYYCEVKNLVETLELNCIISEKSEPLTRSDIFWCKTEALKNLPYALQKKADTAVLNRIFAYAAQHNGYATGTIMNQEYTSMQLSNDNYILNEILRKKRKSASFISYDDLIHYNDIFCLNEFIKRYKKIMIYGTGFWSKRCVKLLESIDVEYEAYIVSDGYRKDMYLYNKKVYECSEVNADKDLGIIVALDRTNCNNVLPNLKRQGFQNILYKGESCGIL